MDHYYLRPISIFRELLKGEGLIIGPDEGQLDLFVQGGVDEIHELCKVNVTQETFNSYSPIGK